LATQWRSDQRSERRFNARGGRFGTRDLDADNSGNKRGVSNPRTGSGTATWQKQEDCSRPGSTADATEYAGRVTRVETAQVARVR